MKLKNLLILVFAMAAMSCSSDDDKTPNEVQNNAPTIVPDQIFPVPETKTPGENLGVVDASDDDEGDTLTFSIEGESGPFVINANTGVLTLAEGQNLDYDTTNTYTLTISVTDDTDSTTETITINITNVNQAPAIGQPGQPFQVPEDATSSDVIGAISVLDSDGDDLTFEIIVNSNNLFTVNTVNGEGVIRLADGKNLDYETATSHEITVQVSDDLLTDQETFTIVVENVIDAPYRLEESSFVLEFTTTMANEEIGVGTDFFNNGYDYLIDWGDGSPVEHFDDSTEPTHIYAEEGTHTVAINGDFPRVTFNDRPWNTNLTGILNWGDIEWETFEDAFFGCTQLENYAATDAPDLSKVTDLSNMFLDAQSFNGDISNWNVSNITNMVNMFNGASSFNRDISNWNVSNVQDMFSMFSGAISFNQDLSNWILVDVNLAFMFAHASEFDQNLGGWDISSVTSMEGMLDNSGLSKENYDATLIAWANNLNTPTNITLGAIGLYYCSQAAETAKAILINLGDWEITDEGIHSDCI